MKPWHDLTEMGVIELASLINACDASILSFTAYMTSPKTRGNASLSAVYSNEIDQLKATKCQALRRLRKAAPENRQESLERLRSLAIIELQNAGDMVQSYGLASAEIHRAFDLASLQIKAG